MTYDEMAESLGIRLPAHFTTRPITRTDTLAFLKVAAVELDPSIDDEIVPWRRTYRICRLARESGEKLGIRLPASYWSVDRAFVLAGVAGLPNEVPLRKQAFDWARR
jgi:hypothetical protein